MHKDNAQTKVTEQIAVNAPDGAVEALLCAIQFHQAPIKDFLEAVEPTVAFQFCAWFIGLLSTQQPGVAKDFVEALKTGIQVGGILLDQYHKENPDQPKETDHFRVIFPTFVDPKQALLYLPGSGEGSLSN